MSNGKRKQPSLWQILLDKDHRERLAFVGAFLAALIGGGWALYNHLHPSPADKRTPTPPSASATNGGVAIVGNVTNSHVQGGGSASPAKP